jgi:hypothetical protein
MPYHLAIHAACCMLWLLLYSVPSVLFSESSCITMCKATCITIDNNHAYWRTMKYWIHANYRQVSMPMTVLFHITMGCLTFLLCYHFLQHAVCCDHFIHQHFHKCTCSAILHILVTYCLLLWCHSSLNLSL